MSRIDEVLRRWEEELLDGQSLNLVGLPGSGRSRCLRILAEYLKGQGWSVLHWGLDTLRSFPKAKKRELIDSLRSEPGWPVILIDDLGRSLVQDGTDGQWLDGFLFAKIHEAPPNGGEYLRCVVSTSPRDGEITGPTSGVRERCKVISPLPQVYFLEGDLPFFAESPEEVLHFSGGNHLLVPPSSLGRDQDKGNASQLFRKQGPSFIGSLGPSHQKRLQRYFSNPGPRHWRSEEDEFLIPLIAQVDSRPASTGILPVVVQQGGLEDLLLSTPWPWMDIECSARRFAARCGDEQRPLWIDNFLSDRNTLDPARLASFLGHILNYLPNLVRLRILSRNMVGRVLVTPTDLVDALGPHLTPDITSRLDWRIYDMSRVGDLHDRQLILHRRNCVFHLPIVRILLGMRPPGNEADGIIYTDPGPNIQAFSNATPVPL